MTHDGELARTADFDAGEHAYEKGDVVDLLKTDSGVSKKSSRLTSRSSLN